MNRNEKHPPGSGRSAGRRLVRIFLAALGLGLVIGAAAWGRLEVVGRRFATGCTPVAPAPDTHSPLHVRLQEILEDFSRTHDRVGLQAVVIDPEGAAFAGSAGPASRRSQCPVTAETLFCLGQVSQMITAALIVGLTEDEALFLGDRLGAWSAIFPAGVEATLEQLLRHTSGMPDFTDKIRFRLLSFFAPTRNWTPLDLAALISRSPLKFPPGHRYEYSPTEYLALAMVAERAAGSAFRDLLRTRVFDPLDLTHIYFEPDHLERLPVARGHEHFWALGRRDVTVYRRAQLTGVHAAGGMVSNASELARFTAGLFGGLLLRPETMESMVAFQDVDDPQRPAVTGYGLGVQRLELQGREMWGHTGSIAGFTALTAFSPEHGHIITVLANHGGVNLPELAGRLHREALIASAIEPRF